MFDGWMDGDVIQALKEKDLDETSVFCDQERVDINLFLCNV